MAKRRSFIKASGAGFFGAIAGCTSDSTPSASNSNSDRSTPVEIIDDRDTVNEDRYLTWEFSFSQKTRVNINVTVRSGPHLDIVFTDQSELQEFEDGNRFRYSSELSMMDSAGGRESENVPAGDYAVIVDNTDRLEAKPPSNFDEDPARVEIRLTAEEA